MPEDVVLLASPDGNYALGPRCLLIAVDETGHEELADPLYPIFGLGGCLTVVGDYDEQIRRPWAALKGRHFRGPRIPLHASGLRASPEQAEALGTFFRECDFGRFAAITTLETSLSADLSRFEAAALLMSRLVSELGERYIFNRVAVIFEHSERTEPLIRRVFTTDKSYSGQTATPWQVPTTFYFARKILAEPIVEVADFVMHAAGTAVLRYLERGVPPLHRKDFAAVFEGGLARSASFEMMNSLAPGQAQPGTA